MADIVGEKVAALGARVQREVDEGRVPGAQLALALDGEVVHTEAFGDASIDDRFVIFSATKPVVASVVWQLIAEGLLDPARPVADVFPEFGANGKAAITLEQVMLHTSGFPAAPLGPPQALTREGRIAKMASWRTNWEPGSRYEYHPTSAHWVLAELISRVSDGRDFRQVVRERVLDPLGLDRLELGVPPERQADIKDLVLTMEEATPDEIRAVFGIDALPVTEVTDDALMGFNQAQTREVGVPGGGAVSDAASLALFYQAVLHDPKGLWDPDLLRDVKTNVRNTFPDHLGVPANRTLGLVLAGDDGKANLRGMGRTLSPGAFGHNGAAGQLAWADPATGLSFAFLTNGIDRHVFHQARRGTALSSLAGTCVA